MVWLGLSFKNTWLGLQGDQVLAKNIWFYHTIMGGDVPTVKKVLRTSQLISKEGSGDLDAQCIYLLK